MNALVHVSDRPQKLRLRVEDFELLEEGGAFADRSKAELIDGDIYVVNAQYARHGLAKGRLFVAFANRLKEIGSDLEAYSEVSLRVAADSMPEPDLFLAPRQGFGPVPVERVALVVEVADSTISTDLGRKADLYAAAGVPEYWVVDLNERRVLMHELPDADGYHGQLDVPFGQTLISATIEGLEIDSAKLVE